MGALLKTDQPLTPTLFVDLFSTGSHSSSLLSSLLGVFASSAVLV